MVQFQLKYAVKQLGTEVFPQLVVQHLKAWSTKIPFQNVCNDGAWPDDKSLHLDITDTVSNTAAINVTLHAVFRAVTCSACFGAEYETVEHTFSMVIDRQTGIGTIAI